MRMRNGSGRRRRRPASSARYRGASVIMPGPRSARVRVGRMPISAGGRMMPGGGGHLIQRRVQLAAQRRERTARRRGRRGVQFQAELVQLHGDPRVGRRGTDGLVARQRRARAVDQEQLQLGTGRGRADPGTGPFQRLPRRAQAFPRAVRRSAGNRARRTLPELPRFHIAGPHRSLRGRLAAPGCGPPLSEGPPGARLPQRRLPAADLRVHTSSTRTWPLLPADLGPRPVTPHRCRHLRCRLRTARLRVGAARWPPPG